LFRSDIDKIGQIIRESFSVIKEDNKIEGYEITSFGYLSIHFIAKLKDEYKGPRYDNIKDIKFEIQVRTLAMDAWATISHYLDYKSSLDVPKELRKDFFALSGLFYVADTHFEMFYEETLKARAIVNSLILKPEPELDQDINLDTLLAYLKHRFPERKHSTLEHMSALVSELHKAGYKTIKQIDNKLNSYMKAFLLYEKKYPPAEAKEFAGIGVVRITLAIGDEKFLEIYKTSEANKEIYRRLRRIIEEETALE